MKAKPKKPKIASLSVLEKSKDAYISFDPKSKTWAIGNKVLECRMRCRTKGDYYLTSLLHKATRTDWSLPKLPSGFSAEIDGDTYLGTGFGFKGFSHLAGEDGAVQLEIVLRSRRLSLDMHLFYRCYPGSGVIETWCSLENQGSKRRAITRLDSISLRLKPEPLTLFSLEGGRYDQRFPPDSFILSQTDLKAGSGKELYCGVEGRSSAQDMPWFALADKAGKEGLFGGLEWSGLWRLFFINTGDENRTSGGITDTTHYLKPRSTFTSPVAIVGLYKGSLDDAGYEFHRWQEKHLIPSAPENFPWAQYNSWYPYEHRIDENILRREADVASDMGFEVFVIDAGWYRGCTGEGFGGGLGDWFYDAGKFPGGLPRLADYIRSKNMKFGLWVEPERTDMKSPLAQAHPDWIVEIDGKPLLRPHRESLTAHLCLASAEVREWIKSEISRVVTDYKVDWLKWDYNIAYGKGCTSIKHGHGAGDGSYQYTLGLYEVLDHLRAKHPHLVIEDCASGGNRIDYGILRRTHTQWISDYTHRAVSVRYHLSGAWYALHPRYLNTWVMTEPNTDAEFRSRMGGAFGVSAKMADWPEEVRMRAAKRVAEYKKLRPLVMKARYLLRPQARSTTEWDIWEFYDHETGQGALLYFREESSESELTVKLRGLRTKGRYEITYADSEERLVMDGKALMSNGLNLRLEATGSSGIAYFRLVE